MTLKSYKELKIGKRKKRKPISDIVVGGVVALTSVALISEVADALN